MVIGGINAPLGYTLFTKISHKGNMQVSFEIAGKERHYLLLGRPFCCEMVGHE